MCASVFKLFSRPENSKKLGRRALLLAAQRARNAQNRRALGKRLYDCQVFDPSMLAKLLGVLARLG